MRLGWSCFFKLPMKVSSTCPFPPLAVSPPRHFIQCFSSLLAHRKQVRRRIREGITQSNSAPTAHNGDGSAGRKQPRAMVTPTDLSFHVGHSMSTAILPSEVAGWVRWQQWWYVLLTCIPPMPLCSHPETSSVPSMKLGHCFLHHYSFGGFYDKVIKSLRTQDRN